jgi:uncharacterized protein (TIGR03118 family)
MRSLKRGLTRPLVLGTTAAALALAGGALAPTSVSALSEGPNTYAQINLVSDQAHHAQLHDGALDNAFGLSASPTSSLWVSDNHSGLTTTYVGGVDGSPVALGNQRVEVPDGSPTGQVFNPTTDFQLKKHKPAIFLFATEGGHISGWNPKVDATHAVNEITDLHAVYKGLTFASTPAGSRLYAANFSEARVDVFDGAFQPIVKSGAFTDPMIPAGYAPFNVQAIGSRVYVSFAKQDDEKEDEVDGHGFGYVDAFRTDGTLVTRLSPHQVFDGPWGMTIAPDNFGALSGALLVGNFGDGRIHAFDPKTGTLLGTVLGADHHPLVIPNLWALRVGNPTFGGTDAVVFTAGPDAERHGLLGILKPLI